jgi:hypothetical protein
MLCECGYTRAKLRCDKCGANSSRRRGDPPHFQTRKWCCYKGKFGHGSRQDPKPRMTVLARTSSNLLVLDLDLDRAASALHETEPLAV